MKNEVLVDALGMAWYLCIDDDGFDCESADGVEGFGGAVADCEALLVIWGLKREGGE